LAAAAAAPATAPAMVQQYCSLRSRRQGHCTVDPPRHAAFEGREIVFSARALFVELTSWDRHVFFLFIRFVDDTPGGWLQWPQLCNMSA